MLNKNIQFNKDEKSFVQSVEENIKTGNGWS